MFVCELCDHGSGLDFILLTVVDNLLHAVVLKSRALKSLANGPDTFVFIIYGDLTLLGEDFGADAGVGGASNL